MIVVLPNQLYVFSARHVRRVPGDRAPGPAATQRGTTPSQATGPAESPAEQVLCRHQRGEDPNKSTPRAPRRLDGAGGIAHDIGDINIA